MNRRTTLRVGGPADLYVEPGSEADLGATLLFCAAHGLQWLMLGRGSNVLVKDGGFRGVVIRLVHGAFSRIEGVGQELICGAGAPLKSVAAEAKRRELTGLEFLEGIPGTVGGALRMNAGAMGSATFDRLTKVRFMDSCGQVHECARRDIPVQYRCCAFFRDHVALGAVFWGEPGHRSEIEQKMNEFSRKRWSSQPAAPSAGCMFKNPATVSAGKLIDELGLKGTRIGGAMVSYEHGNFIVNEGRATAKDILELIDFVRERARSSRGIELESEVEIVGE